MNNVNEIRAPERTAYRNGLGDGRRAAIGENPAATVELDESTLETVGGTQATPHLRGSGLPGTSQRTCCVN